MFALIGSSAVHAKVLAVFSLSVRTSHKMISLQIFRQRSQIRCGLNYDCINFMWIRNRLRLDFGGMTIGTRKIHTSNARWKVVPKNLKGKSKGSQEWLVRQLNDPYVKKAQELNYRARSAFKLIEIDDKVKILKHGMTVVECGAAPGAWTQVIVKRINGDGKVPHKKVGTVIGIDLLPIAPLTGAIFLSGCDFTNPKTTERIKEILEKKREGNAGGGKILTVEGDNVKEEIASDQHGSVKDLSFPVSAVEGKDKTDFVDIILSDMAPNATGDGSTDHYRIVKLVDSALSFALKFGKTGGHFLTKIFDGCETQKVESCIGKYYEKVSRHKPPCSRNDSAEIFILGKFKK